MRRRIIIGKCNNNYYYYISTFDNGKWDVTETGNRHVEKRIERLLNVEINNIRLHQNLLIVKTNDDLIVIDNYLQLNHDRVFKNLNKHLSNTIINNEQLTKSLVLQKRENNHKKAMVSSKILCCAILTSILIVPNHASTILTETKAITQVKKVEPHYSYTEKLQDEKVKLMQAKIKIEQEKARLEQEKIDEEKKYFEDKVKEYSAMYYIDYNTALDLIKQNEEAIKNDYINQEVGIIRTLGEAYHNSSINKNPEVSNMSSLEREKLLFKFANIYEVRDIDTLATMIAVHRLETGNSKSDACIYKNNFGGLRAKNGKTGSYYVMSFKTPTIGAEKMVRTFLNIKNKSLQSKHYNPNRSLEENMNPIYCGEATWAKLVKKIKMEVINDYDLNDYLSKEKPKQLIK
ncbi:MAG: hypothetical protein PHD10_04060 [Bacilli bacterium]|nr:hypothetical protein [Bacilli bacterium]MDD4608285.1 hypothetical protein [Bacilli bacterium]